MESSLLVLFLVHYTVSYTDTRDRLEDSPFYLHSGEPYRDLLTLTAAINAAKFYGHNQKPSSSFQR